MNRYRWMITLLVMLTGAVLRAEEEQKLVAATNPTTDERLRVVRDVDHPASFDPQFTDQSQWEIRAAQLRQQMRVALGLWPMPPRTPLNPVIYGKIDRDEYTIEKVFFSSYPGHYVSGLLYRPKNRDGKLAAVLCPHGHWAKGRFTVNDEKTIEAQMKIGAEGTRESAYAPQQARCAMLARMGCIVFQYDMVGMADSTAIAHRTGFNDVEAELRLQSFMGLQTWNSIRSLDFLTSLPEVDAKRIAVTGESGGGTQTMILCAIDDRPAVSVPAVMVSTHMQGGCICENCSDLRVGTNNIEFASLVAPRPQAMIAANDWTSDLETNGLPQIKSIYRLYGAEDKVEGKHFSFEHNYNQVSREYMYEWVNRWLNLGYPTPVKEKPFVPLKPEEMSVYDADHPRPADSFDAAKLRAYMTATSDAQLAALRGDLPEYRKVVGGALLGMIQDRLPGGDFTFSDVTESPLPTGIKLMRGWIQRKGESFRIPFLSLEPEIKDADATIAMWVHPKGKASVLDENGAPVEAARKLLKRGIEIFAVDVFGTGELAEGQPATNPVGKYAGFNYAGYRFGYNKSVLSNRIHDLLTAFVSVHYEKQAHRLDLIAFGNAGIWALLAHAASSVDTNNELHWHSTAIDLNGLNFDQVKSIEDEMMLPGALKYGGVYGFAPLCEGGKVSLWNSPPGATRGFDESAGLQLHDGPVELSQLVDELLK